MPTRRPHTKSRLGCAQCKKRHIKCDQNWPTCGNCTRTNKQCIYNSVPTTNGTSAHSPASTEPQAQHAAFPAFDSLDLVLMHHFTLETALTLSFDEPGRRIWQAIVPLRAMNHPMLVHGMLALAGMHRAHQAKDDPQLVQRFYLRALDHQQTGIQLYRTQLADFESRNRIDVQEALMAFSAVLGALSFAQPLLEQRTITLDDILSSFGLWRGMRTLWETGAAVPPESELREIFDPILPEVAPEPHHRHEAAIDDARAILHDCQDPLIRDSAEKLLAAIHHTAFNAVSGYVPLGKWPTEISDDFIALMRARDPTAIHLLRLYCTVLGSFQHIWYIADWVGILNHALS